MKILIIDTSTNKPVVIVSDNLKVLDIIMLPSGNQCSKVLASTLEVVVQRHKIDRLAVAEGPGSLTGIRVGVAAAKGLACGFGIELVGFCSLSSFVADKETFASVIDARIQAAYVLVQKRCGNEYIVIEKAQLIPFEQLNFEGCACIVGPDLDRIAFHTKCETGPNPERMVQLAYESRSLKLSYLHQGPVSTA